MRRAAHQRPAESPITRMSDSPGGSRSSDGFAARWTICATAYKPVRRGGKAPATDHSSCDAPHAAAIGCEQTLRRADSVQCASAVSPSGTNGAAPTRVESCFELGKRVSARNARRRVAIPVAPISPTCASLRTRTNRLALDAVGSALAAFAPGVNSAEDQDGQEGHGNDPEENREVS